MADAKVVKVKMQIDFNSDLKAVSVALFKSGGFDKKDSIVGEFHQLCDNWTDF